MRWLNFRRENIEPRFRCFGCCHVQTGTIILGLYHLVLEVLSICILLYFLVNPSSFSFTYQCKLNVNEINSTLTTTDSSMVEQKQITAFVEAKPTRSLSFSTASTFGLMAVDVKFNVNNSHEEKHPVYPEDAVWNPEPLPTPLPEIRLSTDRKFLGIRDEDDGIFGKRVHFLPNGIGNQFSLIMLVGLMVITLMLIYGAIKVKHLYILPYFGYQVFDFTITSLMAISYYSWIPNANDFVNNNPDFPFAQELSKYNLQWLGLFVLVVYVMVLVYKAYFIGVVFACYQYCQMRSKGIVTYQQTPDGNRTDAELLLPPTYDNAVKLPPVTTPVVPQAESPPPPYQNV